MTIQQIKYVLVIARCGSMNKAAELLFISQPALSNTIKELESEVDITIFNRSKRGVSLTNEGTKFLKYARQVYQQYELLEEQFLDEKNRVYTFGVSTQHYSFATKSFIETVKKFDTQEYHFAIRETKTFNVIRDVGEARSEIGVLFLSKLNSKVLQHYFDEYDLVFDGLVDTSAYVYLHRKHPLANKDKISFDELQDYPCLSFEQGRESSVYLAEEILSEKAYLHSVTASDRATMLNLMKGLNGYTLCSGIISEESNGDEYKVIPFSEDGEHMNTNMKIGYIMKKNHILSEVGEVYIKELKNYIKRS